MSEPIDETKARIREVIALLQTDAAGLSRRIGKGKDFIRDVLTDRKKTISADAMRAIEDAAASVQATTEAPRASIVTIVGRIGAGARIDVGVEQVPEGGEQIETVLPLPAGAIGFEVVGDSMWPRYDEGDVIVCEAQGIPIDDLPEGEEAAVRTSEGLRYLKRVYRGQPAGFHNLISHNAPPIQGAQLDWAADVIAIIRRSKWRKITDADRRRLAKKAMAGR